MASPSRRRARTNYGLARPTDLFSPHGRLWSDLENERLETEDVNVTRAHIRHPAMDVKAFPDRTCVDYFTFTFPMD